MDSSDIGAIVAITIIGIFILVMIFMGIYELGELGGKKEVFQSSNYECVMQIKK